MDGGVSCAGLLPNAAVISPKARRPPGLLFLMQFAMLPHSSCIAPAVSVADSQGDVVASQGFSFYTNATKYEEPPDQSDIKDKVGKAA